MRVRIHEADLAAEVRCALGSLEELLRPAVIGQRTIEQPDAVGRAEMFLDQLQVFARLLRREQIFENRMDHRERAVSNARRVVCRMQQVANGAVMLEERIARQHVVDEQQALKVLRHGLGLFLERRGLRASVDGTKRLREQVQHLEMKRDRPRAAHPLAHHRVCGL